MTFQRFVQFAKESSIAKSNKFAVDIFGPSFNTDGVFPDIATQDLSLMCDQAPLPGQSIGTKDINQFGPRVLRPDGSIDFSSTVTLSFVVDQAMFVKRYFEEWLDRIVNRTSYQTAWSNEYLANSIKIHQLDEADNITFTSELIDAFPTSVGQMDYSHYNDNQFHRVLITFAYRKHHSYSAKGKYDANKAYQVYDVYNTSAIFL